MSDLPLVRKASNCLARGNRLVAHQLPAGSAVTLRTVFELRARRLIALRAEGKIAWLQDTGAKVRLLEFVEHVLLPSGVDWASPVDPVSDDFLSGILGWAWQDTELKSDVRVAFRLDNAQDPESVKPIFFGIIRQWVRGATFAEIAQSTQMEVDEILGIHTRAITYVQDIAALGYVNGSPFTTAFNVDINTEYGVNSSPEELTDLANASTMGDLSKEDYLQELKRRGLLRNDFSLADNADRLSTELA